jgi:hypothetical protein
MVQDPMAQAVRLVIGPVHRDIKVEEDRVVVVRLVLELCKVEPTEAVVLLMV